MQQVGKYQLIRKLATGGMAEVFLAKAAGPMGFEKTLVLKRILPHLAEDPAFVEMFLSEAKLAAQLNHPNIVQIFDFGEADSAYFLAMEFIDGPNLRVLLKRARTQGMALPPALCARLVAAACEGLAFAHDFRDPSTGELLGLIHRDISPDNILVSRQGAVKVVDFGIAKAAGQSHKTQSGVIKGKLSYMPPEQIRAKPLDRRVDVYALGVVLYELLTGAKPYESSTDASLMQAILFEPQVPAAERRPDLPEALQRILERTLSKDREQRYPDCLALSADLEEFILSVGKPVTTQQIVQLIAQVAPNTDAPMPTPQPGTPRSGSRASATPVHTPAPVMVEPSQPSRSMEAPVPTLRTEQLAPEPVEPPPGAATTPLPRPSPQAVSTRQSPPPAQSRKWIAAAAGVGLLVLGGGYLLWRPGATPTPPPEVATNPVEPVAAKPVEPPATKQPESPAPDPLADAPKQNEQVRAPSEPAPGAVAPSSVEPPKPDVVAGLPPTGTPGGEAAGAPSPVPPKDLPVDGKRPHKPAPRPPKPVAGKGTLVFRVRPYATVFVNGKSLGQTPFPPVELPATTYQVRFVNEDLKKDMIQVHVLKPGETKTIKLNLEE